VTPFALTSGSQFRPPAPPSVGSTAYDQALSEVASLGRINSATRTADQTSAAQFWSDGPNTVTNPGHWNEIAQGQALKRKGSLANDARLFAMLDVAMADAGIATFDAKSAYTTWRPVSAIQETDPSWTPLETTPASPSYVSDHAAFGAAAANILTSEFGSKVEFTDSVDSASGGSRTFSSFAAAALEDGQSRVWAGQNFSYDVQQGQALGDKVGGFVVTRFPKVK
jgi:hypothetical protein